MASRRKPLTHKQLKTILAVLSQWPSAEEKPKSQKPKLKKPAVSLAKLKAILDDMTPDFIQSLAYHIVAGKRRASRRRKAGKQSPTIGKARKITTRPKGAESRVVAGDMNKNNSSLMRPSTTETKPGTPKKLNLTASKTGVKAMGINLWSVHKPPRRKSPNISAGAEAGKLGPEHPDVGSGHAKDDGRKNGSETVFQVNETKPQEKGDAAAGSVKVNITVPVQSIGEVYNSSHSNLSLINSLETLRGSGSGSGSADTPAVAVVGGGDTSAQDDVVEMIGQTTNQNTSGSGVAAETKQGRTWNKDEASMQRNESVGRTWKRVNGTTRLSKETLRTLAAGDRRSEISRVSSKHLEKHRLKNAAASGPKHSDQASSGSLERLRGLRKKNTAEDHKKVSRLIPNVKVKAAHKDGSLKSGNVPSKQRKEPTATAGQSAQANRASRPKVTTAAATVRHVKRRPKASRQLGHGKFLKPRKAQKLQTGKAAMTGRPKQTHRHKAVGSIAKKSLDEADAENLDDSNSLNHLISRGSHLSR